MSKSIKVTIKPSHADKAKDFLNIRRCLLATALREKFPKAKKISVGGGNFDIDNNNYDIPSQINDKIQACYDNSPHPNKPVLTKNISFTAKLNRY